MAVSIRIQNFDLIVKPRWRKWWL